MACCAWTGTGVFDGQEPVAALYAISNLYPGSIHLVARAGSGGNAVADLSGRKVSLTGPEAGAVLKDYGFFAPNTIPAGTCQGVDQDVATLAVGSLWITRALWSKNSRGFRMRVTPKARKSCRFMRWMALAFRCIRAPKGSAARQGPRSPPLSELC
ncbi:TAXI family TRAP transporter solute-binding subunit [Rhodobacter sp. 24-YEA-8]|uniref:TAXI family TRAP transporter solute-binding subunit n=1 Tax=Rhodobacter sp. 24-YEA-8 TaxID=1884310 RepID=UPI00209B6D7A|nr:TAXI family TRAP transporter solute-binding subunit [Rhodobacter sp. 24-YEA-8]